MYQQIIKHKNIIKVLLAVMVVWLVLTAVDETFSSNVDSVEYSNYMDFSIYNDEGLSALKGDYELGESEILGLEDLVEGLYASEVFTVTVIDAWLMSGGMSGEFASGDVVLLDSGSEPTIADGTKMRLDWEVTPSIDIDRNTFLMPESDVVARAIRTRYRSTNLEGGEFANPSEISSLSEALLFGSSWWGFAEFGSSITIDADVPEEEYRFVRWENTLANCGFGCIQVEFEDEASSTTSFVVPSSFEQGEIGIRAVFEPTSDEGLIESLLPPDDRTSGLSFTKESDPESGTADNPTGVLPWSTIYYTITITNLGDEVIRNVVMQDEFIDGHLTILSSMIRGYFDGDGNETDERMEFDTINTAPQPPEPWTTIIQWTIDRLEPRESFTLVIPTQVMSREGAVIKNTALIVGIDGYEVNITSDTTYHIISSEDPTDSSVPSNPSNPSDSSSSSNSSNPSDSSSLSNPSNPSNASNPLNPSDSSSQARASDSTSSSNPLNPEASNSSAGQDGGEGQGVTTLPQTGVIASLAGLVTLGGSALFVSGLILVSKKRKKAENLL